MIPFLKEQIRSRQEAFKSTTPYVRKYAGMLTLRVGLVLAIILIFRVDNSTNLEIKFNLIKFIVGAALLLIGVGNVTDIFKQSSKK